MAYRRIRFRNCRIQNSDARLVFEERKFCHITPLLRAPPPHFYTFKAPSPPLPHFYSFPPPIPHFYCFPFNTTSTTFHCSTSPPPTHTHTLSAHFYCFPSTTSTTIAFTAPPPPPHFVCFPCTTTSTTILLFSVHNLNTCISFVFSPLSSPPPHFYLFSSTAYNTFLWFLIRYTHHISIVSLHHYLHHIPIVFHPPPRPPFCSFSCTTSTTFLLFSLIPLHQYQISKASPSCATTL